MDTTIKIITAIFLILFLVSCKTISDSIIICGKKFDVYKDVEYDYETGLDMTYHNICFLNTKFIAFSYQFKGIRNDSILLNTSIENKNDSIFIKTFTEKSVYGYYKDTSIRKYRCIENGVASISTIYNSEFKITIDTAKKYNMKFVKK